MTNNQINTGLAAILKLPGAMEEGKELKLSRLMMDYIRRLLLPFVWVIYFLSPELKASWPQIYRWLLFYLVYLIVIEISSRVKRGFYETSLFRISRIQVVTFLGSILLVISGGVESHFWFIYLWPLSASALYFSSWTITWWIYGEVVVLYCLSSLITTKDIASVNFALLLTNLVVLFILAMAVRYLVEIIRKHQAAEKALRHFELLQQVQQDVDTAIDLQEVLDRVLYRGVGVVGAREGSLMLMEEDGKLHFRAWVGDRPLVDREDYTFIPGTLDEGIAGWVAWNCRPYLCQDTETDPKFVSIKADSPIRSLVSVPIISHGTVLGVINADSVEPNHFSETDAELLATLANQTAVAIERARLWDSLRQISEKILGGAEDLNEHIVDAVHRLTRCPVAMWRVDETGTQATIYAHRGVQEKNAREMMVADLQNSFTSQAIRTATLIEIVDAEEDPRVPPESKIIMKQQGWKSILAVPLLAEPGLALGALTIYSPHKKKFATWEIDLLSTFASQAGVDIKTAEQIQTIQQLNEETTKRADEMTFANEVGRLLSATQDVREIPRLLVKEALEEFNAEAGSLALFNPETREIEFQFALDYQGATKVDQLMTGYKMPLDKGIAGAVTQSKEAIISNNVREDPRWYEEVDSVTGFTTRSILAVPLIYSKQVIGVVEILNKQDGKPFLEQEKKCLEAVASSAAIAIQNAQLLQQERILREEAETLRQAFDAMSSSLDLNEVAGKILGELPKIIDCDTASMQLIQGDNRILLAGRDFDIATADPRFQRPISQDSLINRIVTSKEPLILSDTSKDPNWEPLPGVKSWIGLPMVYEQKVIGILTLDHDQPGFYTHEKKVLLARFANKAATDIQKALLLGNAQRRIRDLEIINEIVEIAAQHELKKVLGAITERVNAIASADFSTLFPYDSDQEKFERGIRKGKVEVEPSIPSNTGFAARIAKAQEPIFIEDVAKVLSVKDDFIKRKGVKSFAGIPLIFGGKTAGVLYINFFNFHDFTQEEKEIMKLLANQVAVALKNAQLFERLENQREVLQIKSERSSLVEEEMGRLSLANLSKDRPIEDFWQELQLVFSKVCEILGVTSGVIMRGSSKREEDLTITAEYPRSKKQRGNTFPATKTEWQMMRQRDVSVAYLDEFNCKYEIRLPFEDLDSLSPRETEIALVPIPIDPHLKIVLMFVRKISPKPPTSTECIHELLLNQQVDLFEKLASQLNTTYSTVLRYSEQLRFEEERDKYIQDVSHQLIGPLSGLRAHAENLLRGRLKSVQQGKTVLETLVEQAGLIQRYAENFGYAVRSGRQIFDPVHFKPKEFDSHRLVELLIKYTKSFQGQAKAKEIEGPSVDEISFREFSPLMLDEMLFETLMLNLYDNAVKYSYESSPIEIAGRRLNGEVEIEIVNHGIPLNAKDTEWIFQRYTRSVEAQEHVTIGTGIGLFICDQIVKLHRGTIRALPSKRSIYGNEVKFIITLPTARKYRQQQKKITQKLIAQAEG